MTLQQALELLLGPCILLGFPGIFVLVAAVSTAKKRKVRLVWWRALYFLCLPLLSGLAAGLVGWLVGTLLGGIAYGWGEGSTVGGFVIGGLFALISLRGLGAHIASIADGTSYLGPALSQPQPERPSPPPTAAKDGRQL